MKLKSCTR